MRTKDLILILMVFRHGYLETRATDLICEIRILYVLLLFFGLDIWKSVRTKDLICIVIVFRLGYLETVVIVFPLGRILYVLLLFFGLDIWKPVRTKDLIRIVIVFRLGYLETRAN